LQRLDAFALGFVLAKYHIDATQEWGSFSHDGVIYCLAHLDAHEVVFEGENDTYEFIVTYGLHCFAKDDSEHNIPVSVNDGRESRLVDLERYEASKHLRHIIEKLHMTQEKIYETAVDKYFTMRLLNSKSGQEEPYKVCLAMYKENRKLRIHVTSAFFPRDGKEGSVDNPVNPKTRKGFSVFKIAKDVKGASNKRSGPKEVFNRRR